MSENLRQEYEAMKKAERHRNLVETRYWCGQYKAFAKRLVDSTHPASQESAGESKGWVYQKFDGGQVKDFVLASDYATLTAELAEAREQRDSAVAESTRLLADWQEQIQKTCAALKQRNDAIEQRDSLRDEVTSLRSECERLREALSGSSDLLATLLLDKRPDEEIEEQITENNVALSASGREVNDAPAE